MVTALPIAVAVIAFAGQVLVSFLLRSLGKRVAARHGDTRGWRIASWLPIAALLIASVGLAFAFSGLFQAFDAVGHAAPDQRQQILEEGISEAMTVIKIAGPVAAWLYLGSVVLFAVGLSMQPKRT